MSVNDGYSCGKVCKRSPRLDFANVDLKNITIRSRKKRTGYLSNLKKMEQIDSSDADTTDFDIQNDRKRSSVYGRPVQSEHRCGNLSSIKMSVDTSGIETSRKSRSATCHKNSEDEIQIDLPFSLQSCKISESDNRSSSCKDCFSKCNYRNEMKTKNSSKCLFTSCKEQVQKCGTCKKTFLTVIADVHCGNDVNESIPLQKCESSGRISDVESSSCFQPPYSSTRVCRTPHSSSESFNQPNLQLSGIKELRSPFLNEARHEIISEPVAVRSVSPDKILPASSSESKPDYDNKDDDDDLPCTQPVSTILLHGVIAFVDVKIGNLKISDNLKQQLLSLGAVVEEKFTKRVTHVIFKDGNLSTYKKAKRWKIPLVSLTWISDCATSLSCLPTANYIPSGLDKYEAKLVRTADKDLFDINKRSKMYSATKMKRIRNDMKKLEKRLENEQQVASNLNDIAAVTPEHEEPCRFNLIEEFINNLNGEVREMINRSESPQSSEDIHIPVPLSLLRKCITPRRARTDIKELPAKTVNVNSRINGRRKNLETLLDQKKNDVNDHNLDKENVDNSEEYHTERKSAPSELGTNYEHNKRNRKRNCKDNLHSENVNGVNNKNVYNSNNGVNSQQLTQTSRKRQLLPLDQPANDLISETLNNSIEDIPVRNPYQSPKQKCRKITGNKKSSTSKKEFKEPFMRPVLRRVDEAPRNKTDSNVTENSDSSRRSSFYFMKKRNAVKTKSMVPTIVCTGFSQNSLETVHSIVEQLGKYEIENKVSDRTTHVIVEKENFRTVNLLKGIVRGCWIVSVQWVFESLESHKWISEEQFEVTSFSPAVRLNRYDRQAFGPEYSFELFNNCGPIFVSNKCDPPSEDIKELITLSGGRVIDIHRAASLIIGGKPSMMSKITRVSERWVLDCISKLKVLDYEEYLLCSLRLS